jgi:hypothetical protein
MAVADISCAISRVFSAKPMQRLNGASYKGVIGTHITGLSIQEQGAVE